MEFLNDYGTNWPAEAKRRMRELGASDEDACEAVRLDRMMHLLVRFHFPGESN